MPLVATDSGGPNDIIETCRNGLLVDPRSSDSIAAACETILNDRPLWHRYADAGAKAVTAYDWNAYVAHYEGLLQGLSQSPRPKAPVRQLLVCDIDNTLIGSARCVAKFRSWHQRQDGLAFGVATGRSFHSAMSILEQQNAPSPLVMITSVGSEIYHRDLNGTTFTLDRAWHDHIAGDWDRDGVLDALLGIPKLLPQAPLEQRAFKISFLTDGDPNIVRDVRARLGKSGLQASVIHSHGRYLDILPLRASRGRRSNMSGSASDCRRRRSSRPVTAATTSRCCARWRSRSSLPTYSDGLAERSDLAHSYVAQRTHALGIIEGVAHFRRNAAGGGRTLLPPQGTV